MFFSFFIATLTGLLIGCITGLIPGIHINLIASLLISFPLYSLNPLLISSFIVSMATAHTFLDAIPSIFLGAPDESTALSVLPGHKLLLKGFGYEAVKLTLIGSLLSLIFFIPLSPIFIKLVPLAYSFLKPLIAYILIAVSFFMIITEKTNNKRFWAFFVFLSSGILGMLAFSSNITNPLFPMLSGLFGTSILVFSIISKTEIPKQNQTDIIRVSNKEKIKSVSAAIFSGSLSGLFPGLSSSSSAIISLQFLKNISIGSFLILIGGINTVNFLFSLITFLTLGRARNGAVVAIMKIMHSLTIKHFLLFMLIALITGSLSVLIALKISKILTFFIGKINYKKICFSVIIFLIAVTIILSCLKGLLLLITATSIGLLPHLFGIRKTNAMGCLLLPVIFYFFL